MNLPYSAYAAVYDRTGQSRFSLRMVPYVRELWELCGATVHSVVDLACGTGSAAIALARRGYTVTGVDRSEAMLEVARAKARRWDADVTWVRQDLSQLSLGRRFEAATCLYDSLNYFLVPGELTRALVKVREHLVPGGVFVCDVITEYAVATAWGNETEVRVEPDLARIWRSRYDARTRVGTLDVDYFVAEPDGRYRRISETHQHRGYTVFEMREALEEAGFKVESTYACLTLDPAVATTYRVAYLARA